MLLLAACVAETQQARGALFYRKGEGWSSESEDAGQVEATASAQMKKAEGLEAEGDYKKAIGAYKGLVRKFPTSGAAPQCLMKLGDLYQKLGDNDKAYEAYKKYIAVYPRGTQFDQAVAGEFAIGKAYLEGARKRVMGLPTLSSMARAQEIFEQIIKDAPYSKYAPLAQFNIGLAMQKQEKYSEAVAAYQVVISKYSNDPVAADAQYQIAYTFMDQSRDGAYNQQARNKAREGFEDFIARYPQSEKVAQAKENLKTLQGTETSGSLGVAKFYDKQKNYKAAVIYYNQVLKEQPGSAQADAAKARIEALKTLVGEDALQAGPEKTETGERAKARRKLQAQVDTNSRPDYLGPPVVVPDEVAPKRPKLRTAPDQLGPVPNVEPPLPQAQEPPLPSDNTGELPKLPQQ
jgi:outer membrane protein assembly factor BamD